MEERAPARLSEAGPGEPVPFTAKQGRAFAFPVGAAFAVLAGIVYWRAGVSVALYVLGGLSSTLWLLGLTLPAHLAPVQRAWMALAHAISRVTTPIFLGLMFFLVITPFGLVARLVRYRPLQHKESDASFWQARPPERRRSDLNRQF